MTIYDLTYRAEFLGQQFTSARFRGAIYRDGNMWAVTIRMTLKPGYSGRDHLYDLAIRRVAEELQQQPYDKSVAALMRRLERAAGARDGASEWDVSVEDGYLHPRDPRLREIGVTWEELDEFCLAEWRAAKRKKDARFARQALADLERLTIIPWGDGYIVSSPDRVAASRWPYGMARDTNMPFLPMTSPTPVYRTREEAEEAIATVRRSLTEYARGA